MSETIGRLRARIRLESPVRAEDNLGGATLSWLSQGDVWAEIVAGGVSQTATFDTAPSVTAYTFTINRRTDVRAGWRATWAGRVFRIVGVRDEGAARIELVCDEERL